MIENEAWFGYASDTEINTGSGFGAIREHWFIKKLLEHYLLLDERAQFCPCTIFDTKVFMKELPGFAADCKVRQEIKGILILNNILSYATHHYTKTWMTERQRIMEKIEFYNMLCRWKGAILRKIEKIRMKNNDLKG